MHFFLPVSQNRQQALTTPGERMMLAVKRSLFVAVLKIAAARSLSLPETAIKLFHRPLERHPTDPHAFLWIHIKVL